MQIQCYFCKNKYNILLLIAILILHKYPRLTHRLLSKSFFVIVYNDLSCITITKSTTTVQQSETH